MTHQKNSEIGGLVVNYMNRASVQYPTELGGQSFDLVDIVHEKDQMVNIARIHAQQEYDRIMELVDVLQKQAEGIRHRLSMTDKIRDAEYSFVPKPGNSYWIVWDNSSTIYRLSISGPESWSLGPPENYSYVAQVQMLGDHTWIEVSEDYK